MSNDLDLSGPTVTLFGELDALGRAISDELALRGFSTHTVTAPMGWMGSVTRAVVRTSSPAGQRAFADLLATEFPSAQVVVVRETAPDVEAFEGLDEQCRCCGDHHVVSLIWHPVLDRRLGDEGPGLAPRILASAIADEVDRQRTLTAPFYSTRSVEAPTDGKP